ncbi:MAG: DUF302 domain-containing protein [Gammaproteobacteria bacterium]|nr:DUF302 domain-containing protein [Gammaproteobacteria bacterium]
MRMRGLRSVWAMAGVLLMLTVLASEPGTNTDLVVRGTTSKTFDEVILELNFAITERNFRITGRNTIGKGLRERGYKDFPDVEVIHFCNLEYAHEVLLLDPGYVAMMPCRVSVHEVADKTVVSVVLLPETHADPRVVAFAKRMNISLREILTYVLEE